jgi:Ca2+-binding EF-hand superfamily protein
MTKLDKNGDGFISKDELKDGLDALQQEYTDKELLQIIEIVDSDKDGRISKLELKEFVKSTQTTDEETDDAVPTESLIAGAVLLTKEEKVDIVFNYYDLNSDDHLDKAEIKMVLKDTYGYYVD